VFTFEGSCLNNLSFRRKIFAEAILPQDAVFYQELPSFLEERLLSKVTIILYKYVFGQFSRVYVQDNPCNSISPTDRWHLVSTPSQFQVMSNRKFSWVLPDTLSDFFAFAQDFVIGTE